MATQVSSFPRQKLPFDKKTLNGARAYAIDPIKKYIFQIARFVNHSYASE